MFLWKRFTASVRRVTWADWVQAALLLAAFWIAADGWWRALPRFFRALRWLDFQVYYLSARMLAQGVPVYSISARQALGAQLDLDPMVYNYPPYFTALFAPFGALPFPVAGYLWMGLGLASIVVSVALLARALHMTAWRIAVLALIALLMPATMATFNVGQASFLLTMFFVAAMVVAPRPVGGAKNLAVGALLGVAGGMKVYPLLLAVPYLAHRRFNAVFALGAVFGGTIVAGILVSGWADTVTYWTQVLPQAGALNLYPPNQSARAAIQRLFEPYAMSAVQNRQPVTITLIPLADAPLWGTIAGWAFVAAVLLTTAWIMLRRRGALPERDAFIYNFALMVPAMLMAIPLSWDHYEPHLILPLAVAGLYRAAKPATKILFGLACLCLALHRFWNVILFETPFAGLMMFGFLGVFCAWLALLWNPVASE